MLAKWSEWMAVAGMVLLFAGYAITNPAMFFITGLALLIGALVLAVYLLFFGKKRNVTKKDKEDHFLNPVD